MTDKRQPDWDPRSKPVLDNQIKAYDDMRHRCPVAYSEFLQWSLFKHEDVVRVANDHKNFGSKVSTHLNVPNGMDPPEHTPFRRIVEPYFNEQAMAEFEPVCRGIAVDLVKRLPSKGEVEFMTQFAEDFALEIQCAFMGWPASLHEPLRQWTHKNREATLARDLEKTTAVAFEFDGYIRELLDVRRTAGANATDDPTTRLLHERVNGRLLTVEEIVSIIRNWTVGDLSTMSSSAGIIVQYLAERPELQTKLRNDLTLLPAAIDEILRIHSPFISSRRIALSETELDGCKFDSGTRFTLIWASANRDEAVFGDPDEFKLDRDPSLNLLYGTGIHVCPGELLARLELRVITEELLKHTRAITMAPGKKPVMAPYPASGFASLPVCIE